MAFLAKKHLHVEDKHHGGRPGHGGSDSLMDSSTGLEMGVGLFAEDPAALAEEELRLEREFQHRSAMDEGPGNGVDDKQFVVGAGHLAEEVYCICRQPDIPGVFMLQCERCDEWFHGPCIGLEEHKMADLIDEFVCTTCDPAAHDQLIQQ